MDTKKIATIAIGMATVAAGMFNTETKHMTVQEWQMMTQIYDYEIKKQGGVELENVIPGDRIDKKLADKFQEKEIVDDVIKLKDGEISKVEYQKLRDDIIKKVNKQ